MLNLDYLLFKYGNPETKPIWWPDELLKWSEMKKMGGKKADGLSNVNYNEIQKNILSEVRTRQKIGGK